MILGLCGYKGSGKSTLARMLLDLVPGAQQIAFADPLKRFACEVFDWRLEQLEDQQFKETPDLRYPREITQGTVVFLTPRHALQQLGTEWGRACCEQTWIRYGLRRAQALEAAGCPLVIITDVRFINEGEAICTVGGTVARIARPHDHTDGHASEREIHRVPARYTIYNHGDLEHLRGHAFSLVQMLDLPPIVLDGINDIPDEMFESLADTRGAELENRNRVLADQVKTLGTVLRQVEFGTGDPDIVGCPVCGGSPDADVPHHSTCELRAALDLLEGE